jgi:NitT/TauT family transport system permease protein
MLMGVPSEAAWPAGAAASGAPARDAEEVRWRAAQGRERRRRRLMPALGIVGLLALWWAVVVVFDIKPFIAPSPWAVAQTLWNKRAVLLGNLVPTATEALCGFLPAMSPRSASPRCSCTTGACRRSSFPWW